MRNALYSSCLCFLLVLFSNCNKPEGTAALDAETGLAGIWELREEQTGMRPTQQLPAGNGHYYRFTQTGYERYKNGTIIKSGTYVVIADADVEKEVGLVLPKGQFAQRIVFDNDLGATKTYFHAFKARVIFLAGYFPTDGGSRQVFVKVTKAE